MFVGVYRDGDLVLYCNGFVLRWMEMLDFLGIFGIARPVPSRISKLLPGIDVRRIRFGPRLERKRRVDKYVDTLDDVDSRRS